MRVPATHDREPTDRELVDNVCAGHREDFQRLVRRHNQRLFRAARAITRHDQDAEDVLQQAWLSVYKHLDQFRGDAAFTTWATRIAVHEALAVTRRRPEIAEVREMPD